MDGAMERAADAVYEVLIECLPNEAAAAMIGTKPAMLAGTFRRLLPELRARAFTIAGIERADVLQRVRDRIADLPRGADWEAVREDVAAELEAEFGAGATDEDSRTRAAEKAQRRAEMLIRHHGFQAYQAGMFDLMDRQRDALPYWQYVTVGDEAVRETHAALDGLILPADSPFWKTHFPPWDWGCRCQVVPIDAEEYAEIAAGEPGAAEGRVLSDVEQADLERSGRLFLPNGQVMDVSARSGPGALRWNPRDLRIALEDLRGGYDEQTWGRFAGDMRSARVTLADGERTTAWEWLLDPARAQARGEILAQARQGREMAVAIDWETGERLGTAMGDAASVRIGGLVTDAKGQGRRIVLEHGHPPAGLDLPSPRDVLALAQHAGTVARVGVHAGWVRHTVGLTPDVSAEGASVLAGRLQEWAGDLDGKRMTMIEWRSVFEGLVKKGVVSHVERYHR